MTLYSLSIGTEQIFERATLDEIMLTLRERIGRNAPSEQSVLTQVRCPSMDMVFHLPEGHMGVVVKEAGKSPV